MWLHVIAWVYSICMCTCFAWSLHVTMDYSVPSQCGSCSLLLDVLVCFWVAHLLVACIVLSLICVWHLCLCLLWRGEGPVHTLLLNYDYDYDYDYIMAPQRGRPYGANLGSMGRNTGTWSIRSECLSNITSWSRRKGIENTTLPFIPE